MIIRFCQQLVSIQSQRKFLYLISRLKQSSTNIAIDFIRNLNQSLSEMSQCVAYLNGAILLGQVDGCACHQYEILTRTVYLGQKLEYKYMGSVGDQLPDEGVISVQKVDQISNHLHELYLDIKIMLVSPINFHHLREAELLQDRLREQRLVHQHVVQQSDREYHNRQRVCVIDEVVINNFNQLVLYERIVVSVLVEVDSHIADKLQEYYVRSVFLSPGDDLIEALLQEYSNYLAVVTIEYGHNEMQPHILQLAQLLGTHILQIILVEGVGQHVIAAYQQFGVIFEVVDVFNAEPQLLQDGKEYILLHAVQGQKEEAYLIKVIQATVHYFFIIYNIILMFISQNGATLQYCKQRIVHHFLDVFFRQMTANHRVYQIHIMHPLYDPNSYHFITYQLYAFEYNIYYSIFMFVYQSHKIYYCQLLWQLIDIFSNSLANFIFMLFAFDHAISYGLKMSLEPFFAHVVLNGLLLELVAAYLSDHII